MPRPDQLKKPQIITLQFADLNWNDHFFFGWAVCVICVVLDNVSANCNVMLGALHHNTTGCGDCVSCALTGSCTLVLPAGPPNQAWSSPSPHAQAPGWASRPTSSEQRPTRTSRYGPGTLWPAATPQPRWSKRSPQVSTAPKPHGQRGYHKWVLGQSHHDAIMSTSKSAKTAANGHNDIRLAATDCMQSKT